MPEADAPWAQMPQCFNIKILSLSHLVIDPVRSVQDIFINDKFF